MRAGAEELAALVPLFDAYRRFYGQPGDLRAAETFLAARIAGAQSVIFLAVEPAEARSAVGFVQLYPVFSSVALRRSWLLNDLYVDPAARRRGVGRALLMAARERAEDTGADGLGLETGIGNKPAQALYESLGYRRDTAFYRYFLSVDAASRGGAPGGPGLP
jgi:ribosomal protein S18 acetylase RimI-like enzyme